MCRQWEQQHGIALLCSVLVSRCLACHALRDVAVSPALSSRPQSSRSSSLRLSFSGGGHGGCARVFCPLTGRPRAKTFICGAEFLSSMKWSRTFSRSFWTLQRKTRSGAQAPGALLALEGAADRDGCRGVCRGHGPFQRRKPRAPYRRRGGRSRARGLLLPAVAPLLLAARPGRAPGALRPAPAEALHAGGEVGALLFSLRVPAGLS